MRQSRISQARSLQLSCFPTELGWWACWGTVERVYGLTIGHAGVEAVRSAAKRQASSDGIEICDEVDWFPQLRTRLQRFARGQQVNFENVKLVLPPLTDFQKNVIVGTRKIGYGQTVTYGQLAEKAGYPRAARAVGSVMAANRFPILVPCHRVIGSAGKMRGFSAPRGVSLKEEMLAMEAEAAGTRADIESSRALQTAG